MALWNMYNNTSPLNQHNNPSPPEVQQEALNLHQRESPSPIPSAPSPISIKRERDLHDHINDYPPAKRGLIRSNSDLNRKSSITNNNNNKYDHHIGSNNNNSQMTPLKDNSIKKRSESPSMTSQQIQNNENGTHHLQSPVRHHNKQNGLDSIGTTILNGMQFKIVSKGM